ncbi:hypothetical protein DL93DRAFT_2076719 [Clavulina sp. PMI_390]|nr:hypothetical protein DL93DRAFT_2076719 [Clavulina sp. PMI_390]
MQETALQDAEVASEASFQRLIASHAEPPLAFHPRTPRSARGRFPEEVGNDDDYVRSNSRGRKRGSGFEDSDEEDDDDDAVFGNPSGEGSMNGEPSSSMRWSDSPANAMDVEMASSYGSPSVTSGALQSLMSTPQPSNASAQSYPWRDGATASSGRATNKRKLGEDRYDPYAHPTKRRAVSPSISLSTTSLIPSGGPSTPDSSSFSQQSSSSAITRPISHPLLTSVSSSPMSISAPPRSPIMSSPFPYSHNNGSGMQLSSPYGNGNGGGSGISAFDRFDRYGPYYYAVAGNTTPTSSRSVHSSPILRPVHRLPQSAREREEREKRAGAVNGAASDGVKNIDLGGM